MPRLLGCIVTVLVAAVATASEGVPLLENVQKRLVEARDKQDRMESFLNDYDRYRQLLEEMAREDQRPKLSFENNLAYRARLAAGKAQEIRRKLEKTIAVVHFLEDEREKVIAEIKQ
jgi:hypothetical protein